MYRVLYVIREFEVGVYGQGSTIEIAEERATEFFLGFGRACPPPGRVVLKWFEGDDRSSGWEVIMGE